MKLVITKQNHYIMQNSGQKSLKVYIEEAYERYKDHLAHFPEYSIPFEDEELIYAIADWYGMTGEFSEEELEYLNKNWNLTQYDLDFLLTEPEEEEE